MKKDEAAPGWSITLAGNTVQLVPSHAALVQIERQTGETVFKIVNRAKSEGLSLDEIAIAVDAMRPTTDDIGERLKGSGSVPATLAAKQHARDLVPLIVDTGIMAATAAVILPLAAALTGKTTAAGQLKAE
ncbi:hypothetical protein SAMN06295912_13542 [Sphingomonas laterariae]|uniref:Uncharacterized protein n=1 Tax=Edaphosphingomonas laterariae TaxID=861865 RepID=A0A239JN07_9SPHN|nr:hypothetical protein [Sphingomonas laterariae]SNT06144.1 hypothetical protein SAMN06295912_13542 [Sphingomonas laterariae]